MLFTLEMKLSAESQALLVAAVERARGYAHDYVGVEHVFLSAGMLLVLQGGGTCLGRLRLDVPRFLLELEAASRVVIARPVLDVIPFTPRLQRVLRRSWEAVQRESRDEITPTVILDEILRENDGVVARTLANHIK